jgi:hypothetical protein
MQLTDDWLLVKVALLLIGLTKISLTKYGFYHPLVTESPLGAQRKDPSIPAYVWSKLVFGHMPFIEQSKQDVFITVILNILTIF